MDWLKNLPPDADGGWYGLQISKHVQPRDWPAALEEVPEQHRPRAETYLRGMAARMRAQRKANRDEPHQP